MSGSWQARPDWISIHAPHAGSDRVRRLRPASSCDFNPRSPCGERLSVSLSRSMDALFQSTLPMRGATHRDVQGKRKQVISIHAPHAGSDLLSRPEPALETYFNPRSPCGERRCSESMTYSPVDFNPRSPCGERPGQDPIHEPWADISIHAPHAGSDKQDQEELMRRCKFQSTLPMRGATQPSGSSAG